MQRLFVGRHGELNEARTAPFEIHAHQMAKQLLLENKVTPQRSIILSSIAKWAILTANDIKEDLDIPTLVRSKYLYGAGIHPEMVRDFPGLIGKILAACNVRHEEHDVIVVSHGPLVSAVAGGGRAMYGRMYEVPKDWQNPKFSVHYESLLQQPEMW